jgi:hypothetical protein
MNIKALLETLSEAEVMERLRAELRRDLSASACSACPWCGRQWSIQWEPCEPMAEGDTNRLWFMECGCGARGPAFNTEPEALNLLMQNSSC